MTRQNSIEDVFRRLAAGETQSQIATAYGMEPGNFRSWFARHRGEQRTRTGELRWLLSQRLGLWESAEEAQHWLTILGPSGETSLSKEIKQVTDETMSGLGVSYVVTKLPEQRLVYANPQAETLYRLRIDDVRGISLWEMEGRKEVYERTQKFQEDAAFHRKNIGLAKGIQELGALLGEEEQNRVDKLLAPYIEYLKQTTMYAEWPTIAPSVLTVATVYPWKMTHWNSKDVSLSFQIAENYRPEWGLFQTIYLPSDTRTWIQMVKLRATLIKDLRLPRYLGER